MSTLSIEIPKESPPNPDSVSKESSDFLPVNIELPEENSMISTPNTALTTHKVDFLSIHKVLSSEHFEPELSATKTPEPSGRASRGALSTGVLEPIHEGDENIENSSQSGDDAPPQSNDEADLSTSDSFPETPQLTQELSIESIQNNLDEIQVQHQQALSSYNELVQRLDELRQQYQNETADLKSITDQKNEFQQALQNEMKIRDALIEASERRLDHTYDFWLKKIRELQEKYERLLAEDLADFDIPEPEIQPEKSSETIFYFMMKIWSHPLSQAGMLLVFTAGILALGVAISAIPNLAVAAVIGVAGLFGAGYVYREAVASNKLDCKADNQKADEVKNATPSP